MTLEVVIVVVCVDSAVEVNVLVADDVTVVVVETVELCEEVAVVV
jgi:hypothetical protein